MNSADILLVGILKEHLNYQYTLISETVIRRETFLHAFVPYKSSPIMSCLTGYLDILYFQYQELEKKK